MKTAYFNRFTLDLPEECVNDCAHSGPCDEDVDFWAKKPEIINELNKIDKDALKAELKEYGAWSGDELDDHEVNLRRILWLAAGDIKENSK